MAFLFRSGTSLTNLELPRRCVCDGFVCRFAALADNSRYFISSFLVFS